MIPDSRLIPREVKALVFDCDGTLVDTMPIHWRAWCKICKETGLVFRKTDFYTLAGVPGKKIINVLAKQQGIKLDPSDTYNRKREYFLEGLKTVTAIQCVVRFAQEAHKIGLPTAVASGSSRAQVLKGTTNIVIYIEPLLVIPGGTVALNSVYTRVRSTLSGMFLILLLVVWIYITASHSLRSYNNSGWFVVRAQADAPNIPRKKLFLMYKSCSALSTTHDIHVMGLLVKRSSR